MVKVLLVSSRGSGYLRRHEKKMVYYKCNLLLRYKWQRWHFKIVYFHFLIAIISLSIIVKGLIEYTICVLLIWFIVFFFHVAVYIYMIWWMSGVHIVWSLFWLVIVFCYHTGFFLYYNHPQRSYRYKSIFDSLFVA